MIAVSLWDSTSFKESKRKKFSQISDPSKGRQEINDGVEFYNMANCKDIPTEVYSLTDLVKSLSQVNISWA